MVIAVAALAVLAAPGMLAWLSRSQIPLWSRVVAAVALVVLPRRLPARVGRGARQVVSWTAYLVVVVLVGLAAWYAAESMTAGFVVLR